MASRKQTEIDPREFGILAELDGRGFAGYNQLEDEVSVFRLELCWPRQQGRLLTGLCSGGGASMSVVVVAREPGSQGTLAAVGRDPPVPQSLFSPRPPIFPQQQPHAPVCCSLLHPSFPVHRRPKLDTRPGQLRHHPLGAHAAPKLDPATDKTAPFAVSCSLPSLVQAAQVRSGSHVRMVAAHRIAGASCRR